jgi:hypothetical protein
MLKSKLSSEWGKAMKINLSAFGFATFPISSYAQVASADCANGCTAVAIKSASYDSHQIFSARGACFNSAVHDPTCVIPTGGVE